MSKADEIIKLILEITAKDKKNRCHLQRIGGAIR